MNITVKPLECGECSQPVQPTEPAYRVVLYLRRKIRNRWYDRVSTPGFVCGICFSTSETLYRLIGRTEPRTGTYTRNELSQSSTATRNAQECEGCGRLVVLGEDPCRTHTYCSPRCKTLAIRTRQDRDTSAYRTPCGECGGPLPQSRADRKTCSSACRQRAYRRNHAGVTDGRTTQSGVTA